MTYRTFEHTADIGLEVEAANLNWAFAEAALGLTTVITGGAIAEPVRYPAAGERLKLAAPDLETLLVRWLSEVLFLFEVEDFLVGAAKTRLTPPGLPEPPEPAAGAEGATGDSEVAAAPAPADESEAGASAGTDEAGEWRLTGRLLGEPYDRERHGYGTEVKAVTYHGLVVEAGPPAKVRVIFDL